jgi:heterodisulfide reductase subunit B2
MSDEQGTAREILTIDPQLAQRIQDEIGQNVYLCYQCIKCTNGCAFSQYFDWQPNQIMRAVQLGQEDIALNSTTPWLCASCQTCSTRCPQGLDITAIMEFLTRESLERGIKPKVPEVDGFNKAFMREVRIWGRSYELGMMVEMKLRNIRRRSLMEDMDLGVKMIGKNKMPFIPKRVRLPKNPKPVSGAVSSVAYYPGCSLDSTSIEYNMSSKAVCEALGINLVEPEGWVCCGSSAAHRSEPQEGLRLPMENLRLIEQEGFNEVTMPCAACFNRHKAAQYEIRHHKDHRDEVEAAMNYKYQDSVQVNSLVETIYQHIGTEQLSGKVKRKLDNLKVVCYYGCLLTRPPQVTEAMHPENPTEMDELMTALGAQVSDWSYKTTCCGAAHSLTRPDIVLDLSSSLIRHAREAGAEAIIVSCPLCHANLDARQFQMKLDEPMPVLFFTQAMSIALGLPAKSAALHKNLVDPRPMLKSKGLYLE